MRASVLERRGLDRIDVLSIQCDSIVSRLEEQEEGISRTSRGRMWARAWTGCCQCRAGVTQKRASWEERQNGRREMGEKEERRAIVAVFGRKQSRAIGVSTDLMISWMIPKTPLSPLLYSRASMKWLVCVDGTVN